MPLSTHVPERTVLSIVTVWHLAYWFEPTQLGRLLLILAAGRGPLPPVRWKTGHARQAGGCHHPVMPLPS